MISFSEECTFLDLQQRDQSLYICRYLPRRPRGPGMVIVPPIGRERLRCYREMASLARDLCRKGHPVLRFDYRGEGESTGSFQEATLCSRAEDVGAAADELRRASGVEEICLTGLRIGSVIALMAAQAQGIERLLLVDPICNPRGYARTLLRSNVVLQTHYFGKVTRDAATLRQALEEKESVSVFGFMLGKPLLEELETLDLEPLLSTFAGRSDLIYMSPRDAPPKRDAKRWLELLAEAGEVQARCAVIAFSWTSRKRWVPRLGPLNEAVARCLEERQ